MYVHSTRRDKRWQKRAKSPAVPVPVSRSSSSRNGETVKPASGAATREASRTGRQDLRGPAYLQLRREAWPSVPGRARGPPAHERREARSPVAGQRRNRVADLIGQVHNAVHTLGAPVVPSLVLRPQGSIKPCDGRLAQRYMTCARQQPGVCSLCKKKL